MVRRRWILAGAGTALLLTLAFVALRPGRPDRPSGGRLAGTEDYLAGVAADIYLPAQARVAPIVVLVPGGSWRSADRSGLWPLAEYLAEQQIVAVTATYRVGSAHARFPTPVADIVCGIDFAVQRAKSAGLRPGPVIVLGHSAGAQLAALAALTGHRFAHDCPYPPACVDALIGLSGAYEVTSLGDMATALFGIPAGQDPDLWRSGDPDTYVAQRQNLPALLAHGAADTTLSATYTRTFAARLAEAGHEVRVEIVPGATHSSIYRPEVIGSRIVAWIAGLSAAHC